MKRAKAEASGIMKASDQPLRDMRFVYPGLGLEVTGGVVRVAGVTARIGEAEHKAPGIVVAAKDMPCYVIFVPEPDGKGSLFLSRDGGMFVLAYLRMDGGEVSGWAR